MDLLKGDTHKVTCVTKATSKKSLTIVQPESSRQSNALDDKRIHPESKQIDMYDDYIIDRYPSSGRIRSVSYSFHTVSSYQAPSSKSYESNSVSQSQINIAVYITILEDCHTKLQILGMLKNFPTVTANINLPAGNKPKFSEHHSFIFDPTTLLPYEEATTKEVSIKHELVKYQLDRSFTEQMIFEALLGLAENDCVTTFVRLITNYQKEKQKKVDFLRETRNNISKFKRLYAQLTKDKIGLSKMLEEKSALLENVRNQYEDVLLNNAIKAKYVTAWEKARCYQNIAENSQKEQKPKMMLADARMHFDKETAIHMYIEEFHNVIERDYTRQTEEWALRHDTDLDRINANIYNLRVLVEKIPEKLFALSKAYENHKKKLEELMSIKKERFEKERIEKLRNDAACKIAAWWKGIMVRCCLGPYRKKKGKKGKGKGKGKHNGKESSKRNTFV